MKSTINVEKEHIKGIIKDIDEVSYFMLDKSATERKDLLLFAIALGLNEGNGTPLKTNEGLTRTDYVDKDLFMFQGIFYDKQIADKPEDIDNITDKDAVLNLAEEYANTGFYRLKELKEEFPEDEILMTKLLNDMDRLYKDYFDTYGVKSIVAE